MSDKKYPAIINYRKIRTYTASIKKRLADIVVDCNIASEYALKIEEKEILEELKLLHTNTMALLDKACPLAMISAELLDRKELEEHIKKFRGE